VLYAFALQDEEGSMLNEGYDSVGGYAKEMDDIKEIVDLPLRHPSIFARVGIDVGVFLCCP